MTSIVSSSLSTPFSPARSIAARSADRSSCAGSMARPNTASFSARATGASIVTPLRSRTAAGM